MTKGKTYREDWLDEILDGLALHVGIILNDMGVATLTDFDKVKVSEVSKKQAKQAIQEHIEGKVLDGRIDEIGKFIDAITENEAEREMRGEDCIESHQWQRLSKMADYRIKQLKDKGGLGE